MTCSWPVRTFVLCRVLSSRNAKRRLCVTGQNNVARMARVCPVRLFLEATGACTFLRFQAKPHSLGTGGELDARNGDEEFFGVTVDHIQLPRCMPRMAEGLSAAYSSNGHKTHLGAGSPKGSSFCQSMLVKRQAGAWHATIHGGQGCARNLRSDECNSLCTTSRSLALVTQTWLRQARQAPKTLIVG